MGKEIKMAGQTVHEIDFSISGISGHHKCSKHCSHNTHSTMGLHAVDDRKIIDNFHNATTGVVHRGEGILHKRRK